MASGRLVDYLGHGNAASRPAAPSLTTDAIGVWWSDDTNELSVWDGVAWNEDVGGGGGVVSDGDKGDITVSGSGSVWEIDANAVGSTELASNAVTTTKITDANVTYAKIQDVSAASKLLGRGSAGGAGDVEEITVGSGLSMTGTTLSASGGSASAGWQIGYAYTADTATGRTFAGTMPYDSTSPINTDGVEYTQLATSYTATEAASLLKVRAYIPFFCCGAALTNVFALFKDSTLIGMASLAATGNEYTYGMIVEAIIPATDTSSHTFTLRLGSNSGGNIYVNRGNSNSTLYNNAGISFMEIIEIKQ